ncbi:SRPBCC family protein [Nocardioides sp. NPDC087217]|uniref:SRPBCC family protein n=1 Tax=Nocardioides sp. NPDC087217 TaxID=3364335 RepID=UPI00380D46FF
MPEDYEPLLQDSVEIAAAPAQVWELVQDVRSIPQWSPQVDSTRLRDGYERVELGAQFTNRNSHGDLEWTTHGEIVRFEAEQELAFRIQENWVVWSFRLEPTSHGGTRLTQRRETPDGISDMSLKLTDGFLGGQATFTEVQRAGMRQTLEGIKAAAEGQSPSDAAGS